MSLSFFLGLLVTCGNIVRSVFSVSEYPFHIGPLPRNQLVIYKPAAMQYIACCAVVLFRILDLSIKVVISDEKNQFQKSTLALVRNFIRYVFQYNQARFFSILPFKKSFKT